jgi:hypothetical protein
MSSGPKGEAAPHSAEGAGRLPDFLILGAAKSGTTTLWAYLVRHPKIFMSELKEPEFFSRDAVYERGLQWYRGLFAGASDDQLCGEASTTYSRWPHTADAAARIAEVLQRPRFVYLMRHPIERAFSHYAHHMRFDVTMTFEEALEKDDIYVDCSMYMRQIERYLRFFPKETFLFLEFSELRTTPDAAVRQVQAFLGVEERDLREAGSLQRNVTGPDFYIRDRTTQRLKKIPGVRPLANRLPQRVRDWVFGKVKASPLGQKLAAEAAVPPMLPETRERLLRIFEGPNRELERFLGCEYPHWFE